MDILSRILGVVMLSLAMVWKIISSMSRCAVVLCLWVILVSAVSTVFAFVVHFCSVVQDEHFRWDATWNWILGIVTAALLVVGLGISYRQHQQLSTRCILQEKENQRHQ